MKRRISQSLAIQRHPSTAIRPPSFLERIPLGTRCVTWCASHLNFYRVHMLCFLVLPLVASAVFYASNGTHHIAYIDCLFMVVSAVTVTGLNSVLLADLTTWQQVILFMMMCVGSTSSVSIITIMIRRHFFRRKFDYMLEHNADVRSRVNRVGAEEAGYTIPAGMTVEAPPDHEKTTAASKKKKKPTKLRADMVRRVDVPVRVNEMNTAGWLRETAAAAASSHAAHPTPPPPPPPPPPPTVSSSPEPIPPDELANESALASDSEDDGEDDEDDEYPQLRPYEPFPTTAPPTAPPKPPIPPQPPTPKASIQIDDSSKPDRGLNPKRNLDASHEQHHSERDHHHHHVVNPSDLQGIQEDTPVSPTGKNFPRSRTVEFQNNEPANELRLRRLRTGTLDPDFPMPNRRMSHSNLNTGRTLTRTGSMHAPDALHTGFGGFPNPLVAAAGYARKHLPAVERHLTLPRTTTLSSVRNGAGAGAGAAAVVLDRAGTTKNVAYISFDAVVGRNSKFHGLTSAQQEELGGVEYRALTALIKIVCGYWLLSQLCAVLVIAPYLTYSKKYHAVFEDPVALNPTFFTFFQVWSAFSNNGMSLVDTSMVPFRDAYPLIVVMCLLILGGNTAFPIFLRLVIWVLSKVMPRRSRIRETLQFLLDHPRRCFIYLFPSHQTWFLVFALVVLNSIDWVSFLVLDIGNPEIESIPVGTRVLDGLLQAFAVRSAGFATVTLANLAPAVQLLYVVMMYVAVYPIALSIRSTNVYEERSMGVFDDQEDPEEVEARFEKEKQRSPTGYIAYHARKQLTFDMWWLVLALWLICIVERHNISDADSPWITIFTIMFEVCSAYGTVGLSLGTPTQNTSLAGTLRTLSKLVLCAVMIRGRHRGLPIAIDRAVLLPSDLVKHNDDTVSISQVDTADNMRRKASFGQSSVGDGGLSARAPLTDDQRNGGSFAAPPDEAQPGDSGAELSSLSSKEGQGTVNKDQPGWLSKA